MMFLLYMLFPFASETKGGLYCLLFAVNETDMIEGYEIKVAGRADELIKDNYDAACRESFWDKETLPEIRSLNLGG